MNDAALNPHKVLEFLKKAGTFDKLKKEVSDELERQVRTDIFDNVCRR